ncbi:MAG: hypothetical protein R3B90_03345 [Planctomycetaceae bacterium]
MRFATPQTPPARPVPQMLLHRVCDYLRREQLLLTELADVLLRFHQIPVAEQVSSVTQAMLQRVSQDVAELRGERCELLIRLEPHCLVQPVRLSQVVTAPPDRPLLESHRASTRAAALALAGLVRGIGRGLSRHPQQLDRLIAAVLGVGAQSAMYSATGHHAALPRPPVVMSRS